MRVVSPNHSSRPPRHRVGLTLANIIRLIYDCPERSIFGFQRVYFWSCFGRRQLFGSLRNNRSYVSEAKGGQTTGPSTRCAPVRCAKALGSEWPQAGISVNLLSLFPLAGGSWCEWQLSLRAAAPSLPRAHLLGPYGLFLFSLP